MHKMQSGGWPYSKAAGRRLLWYRTPVHLAHAQSPCMCLYCACTLPSVKQGHVNSVLTSIKLYIVAQVRYFRDSAMSALAQELYTSETDSTF